MTLATRCPACGTVFRVVQDQLRVSDGWVRCGRCTEVFNAVEHLVDAATAGLALDMAGAPGTEPGALPGAPGAAARVPPTAPRTRPAPPPAGDDDLVPDLDVQPPVPAAEPDRAVDDLRADPPAWLPAEPAPPAPPEVPTGLGSADLAADLAADPHDRPLPAVPAGRPAAASQPPGRAAAPGDHAEPLPSFLRQADRAARWRRPRVRAALAAGCGLALALLLGQAALAWRDLLAARWPVLQPALAQTCTLLGCTLQPPRRIDALVVDSSALLRLDAAPQAGLYRLSVALRNRESHAVALPALDLTLTDTQGRLVARRVLQAAELPGAPEALAAGAEWVAQATLQAEGMALAGYTIELFYP
jgi:predicted Zn finger-like uncharacterized protein